MDCVLLHLMCYDACIGPERAHCVCRHLCFAFSNMAVPEKELAVQIAGLDGVHVDLHSHLHEKRPWNAATCISVAVRQLTSSMCSNPVSTSVFRSSQPIPPAPTQRTLAFFTCSKVMVLFVIM
jgi:hypothetical protein